MKLVKSLFIITTITVLLISCKEQQKEVVTNKTEVVDLSQDKEKVLFVMKAYKDAIQNLTTEGTFELFTQDATVFEQGKDEGTYDDYINHHLGPELGHFKSFTFSNYKIDATVNLPYAYTTENYLYTIVLKGDKAKGIKERTIESKGVATSVLEKIEDEWKIIHSHTSFKKIKQ
ncbi:MAG: nuclear transport factor 2 family protein [Flavobacteriaceae bacterium]|nr:nuclear transport factor 2 family protein [Flavobacteriaceae bacterium]